MGSFWDRVAGRESPFVRKDDPAPIQAAAPTRGDGDDYWYGSSYSPSVTGLNVSAESAMRLSTAYRCVKLLASSIATPPLEIMRKLPDGGRAKATNHPLWTVLHDRPNNWMTSVEFRMMMQGHLALRGNAYSQIVPGARGPVDQLLPIHPDRVRIERQQSGELAYKVAMPTGSPQTLMQEEVFHLRGFSFDGIRGISPIDYEREVIGGGLAAQEFGNRFFANDATPGGTIEHPGKLSDVGKKHLKESLQDKHAGVGNAHSPMILEEGMKWTAIGISNRDAQFLESRNFSVLDVCRIWGIPPHMVAANINLASYSSIEQQSLEFIMYVMAEWIAIWEQAISRDLIIAPDIYYAQFDLDSLLRGDKLSRYQSYHLALSDRWMNRNEVRAAEGLNREDGLDEFDGQASPGLDLTAPAKTPARPANKEPDEDDDAPEDSPGARARFTAAVHDTRRQLNERREAA